MTSSASNLVRGREIVRNAELRRDALPSIVVFVALVGLAFENGGFFPRAWTTASVALLWVTALVLLLAARVDLNSLERMWIGLLAGLLAWTALSTAWSVNHTESVLDARRDLLYLAAVVAVLLLATRRSGDDLLTAVWAAIVVVVTYALVRYLFEPGLRGGFQENLLFRPLGYANALGIFSGLGAILSIAFAVRAPRTAVRVIAAAAIAPLVAALYLTSSRGSALAVGFGLAAMVATDRNRRQLVGALVVFTPAAAAVAAAAAHSRLDDPATVGGEAARQGHLLALWIVLGGVALALALAFVEKAGFWVGRLPWRSRGFVVGSALAAIVGVAFFAIRWGGPFLTTGYRPAYWHVAWREYAAHPWLGSGAGTFGDYWQRLGNQAIAGGALDAHNLYLETLAELGPIGLVLLVALLGLPLVTALRVRWHPLASAATGAYVAFLLHAALDWDWEMPVVTLAGLVCAAALVVFNRKEVGTRLLSARSRGGALALTLGLALFALVAQFVPGLGASGP
jgi:O-Antigen ligase